MNARSVCHVTDCEIRYVLGRNIRIKMATHTIWAIEYDAACNNAPRMKTVLASAIVRSRPQASAKKPMVSAPITQPML